MRKFSLSPSVRSLAVLIFCATEVTHCQTAELQGQASGRLSANVAQPRGSQIGLRYIPDFLAESELGKGWSANLEVSLNAFSVARYENEDAASYDARVKLYRTWLRLSTERFEARLGLQKISFGSALLLRPLMWFDRIDPRDPLQLTDGVYGMLARYYFQNNANLWLWGLYGNNDTKGWELKPTQEKTIEYGGRAQSPLWNGEVGVTYHHRRAGRSSLSASHDTLGENVPEDRIGLDGKWDIGIGLWFEAAPIRQEDENPPGEYQRLSTIGADYTFSIGNGLYAATEFFRTDTPVPPQKSIQAKCHHDSSDQWAMS